MKTKQITIPNYKGQENYRILKYVKSFNNLQALLVKKGYIKMSREN